MFGGNRSYPLQPDPRTLVRVSANEYQYRLRPDLGESYEKLDSQDSRSARPTNNADTLETFTPSNVNSMPTPTTPMRHPSFRERSSYLSGATQRTSPPAPVAPPDGHAASMQGPGCSMPLANATYITYSAPQRPTVQINQAPSTPESTLASPFHRSYSGRQGSNGEEQTSHPIRRIPAPYPPVITYGSASSTPVERPKHNGYTYASLIDYAASPTIEFEPYEEQPHSPSQAPYRSLSLHQRDDNNYLSPSLQGHSTLESSLKLGCRHCGKQYNGKHCQRSLSRHIETKHSPSSSTTSTDNGEVYKCAACEKKYHRKDAKLKHEREKHPELERPPKVPRPRVTQSQNGSPGSVTRHDSRTGLGQSASTTSYQNPDGSYNYNNLYNQYE